MGMDQQGMQALQKGFDLADSFMGLANGSGGDAAEDLSEANAGLTEQAAAATAHDQQRQAKKTAAEYREAAEEKRAAAHAGWGASNLAMSGSKQLINQSDRIKDRQTENDILFEGDQEARSVLNQGRDRANLLRINGGGSANRSTLALGSKLYKYGG